ncbi:hypothetical protein GCM10008098_04400 [Rhodanobacter panaciterrae]|uniref:Filamentous haemagglutinin FhaB/tRNA nuclease CdiA-like TPS domain-containing protein n=1 Tax=Rhodanobacter panaciterrae TaxID=490572 RepID=A0ABQ2ZJ83_9GAMM|nr:filamentous hemagglutinin N-terminal domain-containing protein [Rhodanobacter panaciterrae]GGY16270.1 hypothetical protein GCM10008098_04400 [Rhodanobacter panaciterrae]
MSKSTRTNQRVARMPARPALISTLPLRKTWPISLCIGLVVGSVVFSGDALAGGPTGGVVVGGSGTITQTGNSTIINQASNRLALNWQTFNVGANESVLFNQPGRSAVALNRILDQNPSQIFGRINSNGQVFLINTHGIIFGATAQMNVGGLLASTLDLTPNDFLAGHYNLNVSGAAAGIVNHGLIQAASGGSVSLVGGSVLNDGLIFANYGKINLDGADHATLDFDGNGLINIQITGDLKQRLDNREAAVTNKGTLSAEDGTVVLQASAAKDLFTTLVNNSGVIDASGISTDGGVVRLVGNGGNVESSGSINVSGVHGGTAQLLSDQNVGITGGSINASGTLGGGNIRVGGGWQAGEGLQTAAVTYVAPDAILNADATRSGDGGSVVVWGNQGNNFYGSISARGGASGGNGGRVETSSHYGLNAQGSVDASAAHGLSGTWLLDPYDVTIDKPPLSGTAWANPYTPTATSTIRASDVGAAVTGGTNVFVFTNTAANGADTGNITVNTGISASGAGNLYLEAVGSIFLNANISGKNATNPLGLYLWANYGGAAAGTTYSSQAACSTCVVTIGNTANAAITTFGGDVDIRTGDASHAGGAVNIGNGAFKGSIDTSGTAPARGALTVNAAGITQLSAAGNSIVAGAATFNAGANAITLGNAGNNFSGAVSLAGSNVSLTNNAATVLGASTVTGTLAVGSNGALTQTGTLTVTGAATFTQNNTTAGATQDINLGTQANDFKSGVTFAAGAGAAINNLSLENTDATPGALTLPASVAGNLTLNYTTAALTVPVVGVGGNLDVSAGGAGGITINGNVSTGGGQTYHNAVTLGNDATLASTGNGAIDFVATVDGAHNLTVNTGGLTTFGGAVGGTAALTSLTTDAAGSTTLGGNVSTTGAQTYNDAMTLGGDATLASSGGGAIDFASTVNGAHNLIVNTSGLTTLGGAVGGTTKLTSLNIQNAAGSTTLGGNVSTTGAQTYSNALTLGADATLASTGNGAIDFAATVDGAHNLTVNTGGVTTFGGVVGGTTALTSLTTDATGSTTLGGNVSTTGAQTYNDAVTLGGDATLASSGSGAIKLASTVNGAHNLTVNTGGVTTFGGVAGGTTALTSLTTDAGGSTTLGGNVSTTGAQTYNDAVTLNGDSTLTSTSSGAIDLASTVDGAHKLSISTGGAATLGGAVGGTTALTSLTANSGTFSANALTINGPLSVTTTAGGIAQGGAFNVAGTSSFNAGANAITLTNAANAFTGAVSLTGGNVSLTNNQATVLGASTVTGTLAVGSNGALTQTGALTVTGAATFTQNNTTAGATQDINLGTQANDFKSGVTFAVGAGAAINNLSLENIDATSTGLVLPPLTSVTGNLTLNYVNAALTVPGGISLAGALDVSAGGGITISGNVSTGGGQTYRNAVTLGADATLASTGSGAIDFVSTMDGAHNLTVNTGGLTTFGGAVGGATALTSLTTDAAGSTTLGGNVSTTGAQTYNDAVTLSNDAILASTGNGAIDLVSTVDGAHNLAVYTGGLTTFGGAVGATNALTSLSTDATGSTILGGNVTTSSAQVYADAVSLGGDAILSSAGSFVVFQSTVDGAHALTVNTPASVTEFVGNVGSTTALTSLTLGAGGNTWLIGNVTTSGAQTYGNAVTLLGASPQTLTGSAIGFASTLDGAQALTVNASGATTFGGVVGGTTALTSLTTDAAGSTTLNGNVTTTGAQTYNDAVALGGDSTLTSTGSGAIDLASTVDGAHKLSISTSGAATLGGAVGGTTALTSLTANSGTFSANALTINGPLSVTTTAGGITQGGAFNVTGASSFNAGTNAITLTNASNAFTGAVSLTGGNVSLTNNTATALGTSTVTGTLAVGSNGALTETGALTVTGAATFTQNNTTAGSTQDILLGTQANDFKSGVTFATGVGAAINNLSLENIDATPGALTLPTSVAGNLTLNYTNAALTVPVVGVGGNLDVSAGGTGGITINGNVSTGGTQTYNNAVTLSNDAILASTGNGAIDFVSTVDGLHNLTVNTGGLTTFGGAVGGTTALTSLQTDAAGSTLLGGNVSTSGFQIYNDAVTLGGDATLSSTGSAVIFESTVDGAHALTVNTPSDGVAFVGNVGSTTALTSFTLGAGGITELFGNVTTSGAQTYGNAVTLFGASPQTLTGSAIDFVSTLNGAQALTVNATGMATFGSAVGGTTALTSLNVNNGAGSTTLDGNVSTTGAQTYSNAVTLGGDATLASSGGGAIDLVSTVNGAHNLTVNTSGVTTFGGVVGGTAALTSLTTDAAGSTTLGGNVSTTGAQTYNDAVTLNGDSTLTSTSSGAIDLASTVDGAHTLSISTGGAATLGGAVGGTTALTSLTANSGTFSANALTINGPLSVTTTAGGITQGGAFNVTGASSFNAGTNAITLTNAGNAFGGVVSLTGGTTQITNASALTLGAVNTGALTAISTGALNLGSGSIAGNLQATSNNGAVSQSGALAVSGTSTINAGTGAITLANAGNTFGGATSLTGGATQITSASALTLGALSTGALTATSTGALNLGSGTIAGNLQATSNNGAVSQSGALAVSGTSTINAGTGAITLANAGNAFGGAVSLTGGATQITNASALTLGAVNTGALTATSTGALNLGSGTIAGNLQATSNNGAVSQSGALAVSGTSTINAGTGAITLANAGNTFGGATSLTGGTTQITSASALTLGALSTGALTAISTGALNLGSGTIAGNLQATSNNGAVSQSGALAVSGTSTINAGTGAITLANAGNAFGGVVNLTGGATQITNASALTLGAVNTGALTATSTGALNLGSGTIAGNLQATSNSGAVSQSGALAVSGTSTINAGTGAITLANAGNTFGGATSLTGGATQITSASALTLGALSTGALTAISTGALNLGSGTIAGNLQATSNNGAVSQSGALTVSGTSNINAGTGAITLANAGNAFGGAVNLTGGATQITNASALTLGAVNTGALTVTSGDLAINGAVNSTSVALNSSGAISEGGSGSLATGTLTGQSTGATTLNGTNLIGTLGSFNAAGFSLTNAQSLAVTGPVNGGASTALTTTAGDLAINGALSGTLTTLNSAGAITEAAGGVITAGTLTGQSVGSTDLNGANLITTLGSFTSDFSLTNAQTLTVAGPLNGGPVVTLTTTAGDIIINGAVNGTTTTLNAAGAISEGAGGVITASTLSGQSGGATSLTGANHIGTLGSFSAAGFGLTNAQTLAVTGPINGGSSAALTTTTGDLAINGVVNGTTTTLTSAGAISEGAGGSITAGTLNGQSVGATALNGTNHIGTLGSFSAAGFGLTNAQALAVSGAVNGGASTTLTTAGNLAINGAVSGTTTTLTSTGAISEGAGGNITASTLSGQSTGATALNGTNHIGTLGSFSAAGFGLTNAQTLAVSGPINGGASTALTTTAGDLAINGAVNGTTTTLKSAGAISEGAAGSITASTLSGQSAGATSLNGANHIGTLGSFSAAGFGLTNAQALTVAGPINGGNSTALTTTAGDLAINGAVSGNTTTLKSAGAISEGASGVITAGTLSGQAVGTTTLGSAAQRNNNMVSTLGNFSSPAGFSMTNNKTLTLASVAGSTFTVNAGTSNFYLSVTNGDLFQLGTTPVYDGTGIWGSTGRMGTGLAPIYVVGTGLQLIANVGLPPAYFYAIDSSGNLLPLGGGFAVNVPTAAGAGGAQNNNHGDSYIDPSVITANYRSYGIVPSGVRLPADQQSGCDPDQPDQTDCQDNNSVGMVGVMLNMRR